MAEDFCGTDAPSPGKACMQSLLTRRDAAGFSVALKQAGEKKTLFVFFMPYLMEQPSALLLWKSMIHP